MQDELFVKLQNATIPQNYSSKFAVNAFVSVRQTLALFTAVS